MVTLFNANAFWMDEARIELVAPDVKLGDDMVGL